MKNNYDILNRSEYKVIYIFSYSCKITTAVKQFHKNRGKKYAANYIINY